VTDLDHVLSNLPESAARAVDIASAVKEMEMTCDTAEASDLPRLYQVETTSRCNLECPFCPRTTDLLANARRDLSAIMPLEKFEGILDSMPWLKSLELFHFGEPFMHKDFDRYVAACKKRGIYTVVASNLLPATPQKLDAVFEAGLDFLVMDVDSLDPVEYERARVGGNLKRLQAVVVDILSRPKHKRPFCVAQTIMLDGKPAYTMNEFKVWSGGLEPDELRYKFLDSFRGEAAEKKGLAPNDLCREPFFGFTVHVNGNVVPCDRDWAGENVMGNIFEQRPLDIWRGKKFEDFRAKMKSPCKPDMCKGCSEGRLVNLRSQGHIQVNMFRGEEIEHS
jgi:radical SAM protein with 4Fe4S-binding SPASM domain